MFVTALVRDLDEKQTIPHWKPLLQLCTRCAQTVVKNYGWSDFCIQSALNEYLDETTRDRQSRIDSLLFATSFAAALLQAQNDYSAIVREQQRYKETISMLEKSNKRKDEHICIQKRLQEDSRKQIVYLKQQLNELRQRNNLENDYDLGSIHE